MLTCEMNTINELYNFEVLDEYIHAEDVESYLDFLCKPGVKPGGG